MMSTETAAAAVGESRLGPTRAQPKKAKMAAATTPARYTAHSTPAYASARAACRFADQLTLRGAAFVPYPLGHHDEAAAGVAEVPTRALARLLLHGKAHP